MEKETDRIVMKEKRAVSRYAFSGVPSKGKSLAVSLFAGCGGFCEGIKRAGFEIRVAVELDRFACETYRHNFPDVPLFDRNIQDFLKGDSFERQIREFGLQNVDLVFGGPPCQGFSQIGTRQLDDSRNVLYREFVRVVRTLRPRMFLMENVPNLLLMSKGVFRDRILRDFAAIGYSNVTFVLVSAADYGVPQLRKRVVFIGTRDEDVLSHDLKSCLVAALEAQRVPWPVPVKDAISDLPERVVHSGETMQYPKKRAGLSFFQKMMRLDYSAGPYSRESKRALVDKARLHNHHTKEMQERRKHLISYLEPGAKGDSLPKRIWNGARPEKWRRLHPDEPSYTILAQMHRDLSEWVHPKAERWITVREAARLQSFHDGFIFQGSEWQQLKQIGNAVPPLLGFALGRAAAQILEATMSEQQTDFRFAQRVLPLRSAVA